jgi:cellulose biosynthesis protein BcsQ
MRTTALMLVPSTKAEMTWTRFSVLSRFIPSPAIPARYHITCITCNIYLDLHALLIYTVPASRGDRYMESIDKVLENHRKVVEEAYRPEPKLKYRSYAITTLRGGVGKSTLAFNLAFEMAAFRPMLVADLCAQCNLTETLLRDAEHEVSILDALQPALLGPAFGEAPSDLSYRVSQYCDSFKTQKPTYVVPGNPLLFAFPSTMYQQLQIAHGQSNPLAVKNLLESLKKILNAEAKEKKLSGILMDTSPFYAGGTHLAWCAADALIVPVRVDEHSLDSLELTLNLISDKAKDFVTWNERAG